MLTRTISFFNNQSENDICATLIKNDFPNAEARSAYLAGFCASEQGRGKCLKASIILSDKYLAAPNDEKNADLRVLYLSLIEEINSARGTGYRAQRKKEFEDARDIAFGI